MADGTRLVEVQLVRNGQSGCFLKVESREFPKLLDVGMKERAGSSMTPEFWGLSTWKEKLPSIYTRNTAGTLGLDRKIRSSVLVMLNLRCQIFTWMLLGNQWIYVKE